MPEKGLLSATVFALSNDIDKTLATSVPHRSMKDRVLSTRQPAQVAVSSILDISSYSGSLSLNF